MTDLLAQQPLLSSDEKVTGQRQNRQHDEADRHNGNQGGDQHRQPVAPFHLVAGRAVIRPPAHSFLLQLAEAVVPPLKRHPHGLFLLGKRMVAGDEVTRRHFLPLRHGMLADFRAVRAARMEFAALRRVDRAGNIAFQNPQLAVLLHVRGRNRGHQCLGVRVQRMVKQLLRVRQLDHVAQIQTPCGGAGRWPRRG